MAASILEHILSNICGLEILENNMERAVVIEIVDEETKPNPIHLAAVLSLNWFNDWKRNVDLYWRVRNVVSSRSDRLRLSDKGADIFKVLNDFFIKMERGDVMEEEEFIASVWILRDMTEGCVLE